MDPGTTSGLQDETVVEGQYSGKTEEETETSSSRWKRSLETVLRPGRTICVGNLNREEC
jgi:hypothetical protein